MKICPHCKLDFESGRKDKVYCSNRCGNNVRSQRWRNEGKETELRNTPKGKYHIHKTNAEYRGVSFELSFDEWWDLWKPYWSEDNYGKLCMCRTGDKGAYQIGNVRIDTWQNNLREARNLHLL